MKIKTFFFFLLFSVCATLGWGQTWNLSETMTAVLDSDGVLTISTSKAEGEAMPDYSSYNTPWQDIKDRILSVVIGDKVTTIGTCAFQSCQNLLFVSAIFQSDFNNPLSTIISCFNIFDISFF